MNTKVNPTLIGLFIVAGLALGVAGVLLVSSPRFFTGSREYILYFDGSLRGLNPGAPVKYRGVPIGSVREVMIHFNQHPDDLHLPVLIEIRKDLVRSRMEERPGFDLEATIDERISRGLRGTLRSDSLVTGLLYVELDDRPEWPAQFHQIEYLYPEIPTVPTETQELFERLARLDVQGISDRLIRILTRLEESLANLDVRAINTGLTNVLASVHTLVNSEHFTNSLASVRQTVDEFRLLSEKVRNQVDPVAHAATNVLKDAQHTLAELRQGIQEVRDLLAPEAALRHNLNQVLEQSTEAARSLATFVEFLKRHPNALLTGKQPPQPKP